MFIYDEIEGWVGPPGYSSFQVDFRGGKGGQFEDLLDDAGVELLAATAPASTTVAATRFDAFFIAHVRTRPVAVSWTRDRTPAQRRYAFLFVESGTVEISGQGVFQRSRAGGLGMIHPGAGEVVIEASSDATLLSFTFDSERIPPLPAGTHPVLDTAEDSAVFRTAFSCLYSLTQFGQPDVGASAQALRGLTREIAAALLCSSTGPDPATR